MLKVAGWLTLTIVLFATLGLSVRLHAQRQNARALGLGSPAGVEEANFVTLGGVPQWVQLRGEDTANPVVLILHGGPGMSYVPLTQYFRAWERHFTVVQWDRRGVGKTYGAHGTADSAAISFERLAEDGVELAEWLRKRFGTEKVVLLGHSMGSAVGLLMAARRPDLFSVYIGTDQVIDLGRNERVSWEMLVEWARQRGDSKLLASVESIGPPPYATVDQWFAKQRLISATDTANASFENSLFKMVMTAPGYSMKDMRAFGLGLKYSASVHLSELMTLDLRPRASRLELPVVLIEGEDDRINPTALALEWFESLEAPRKIRVLLSGGHNSIFIQSNAFLEAVLGALRAIATGGGQ